MMENKYLILCAKGIGMVVIAAIVDIAYQYFTKPELNFYRTVAFALICGLGNFIYDLKKNKK
jgi:hypothetical protein